MSLGTEPSYAVEVWTRGGGSLVLRDDAFSRLSWGRRVNETSDAALSLPGDCSRGWDAVEPWVHELAVIRCGDVVWGGPVVEPSFADAYVEVSCRDVTAWFERRQLRIDVAIEQGDAAVAFAEFAEAGMSADPSPSIPILVTGTGIGVVRKVSAQSGARVADLLRELSRTAIDYTAVGRSILVGGVEVDTPEMRPLNNDDLIGPRLVRRGLDAASRWVVIGAGKVRAEASESVPVTGLLEATASEPEILDTASAVANAQSRLAASYPYPIALEATLSPSAPGFDRLIPGARVPVRCHVRSILVNETMRLGDVRVEVSGGAERVAVTFIPLGVAAA